MNYSWQTFCNALLEINNTEFYMETYPEIYDLIQEEDFSKIVKRAITHAIQSEKIDPTQALNDYLTTLLDGSRYALEDPKTIAEAIEELLKAGAIFPYERLFKQRYATEEDLREDEIIDYEVRGYIIDILKPECAKDYANWSCLEGTYWEDMDIDIDFQDYRFRYLKHCSKYLQTL